ncbi:urea ABC transporter permease subunit UrtC [Phyllobacterium sp. SB3]|uniref:urea ABC transporter permease subunit UrtC n=1 Tax=Phyllobacterium sp. SB3 TaxID=3156073 RepID=UPI0032AFAF2A
MISMFLFKSLDRNISICIAILLAIACIVPALNLLVPADNVFHVPTYAVSLFGKYLTYALLALALDLVWGFCGILSLGHAAFFALGGYAMGMYLVRQIGSRGVYGNPLLPDFMVFLNWKEMPWYWYGFDHFWFAALMVLAVPGLLAFVFGWLAFRSRVTGVYLSIITQAMTYALLLAFFRNEMGFGGNNGLTDFKDLLGFNIQSQGMRTSLFAVSAIALAVALLISSAIVRSKFGKVLVGLRDAEGRTRFLGYRPENYKLVTFTVSAMMAGVAGALYVPQVGIINPGEFAPANSIEVVIWTAVGGRGTLIGPIIGATLVNFGKSIFTAQFPEIWLFALGALFVATTLFLPKGIVGTVQQVWRSNKDRKRAGALERLRAAKDAEKGAKLATEPLAAE